MSRIIINASAAKYGGAKTIVDSFVSWIAENDNQSRFVLLAPLAPDNVPDNVEFRQKETSGVGTLLFSCLFILLECLRFRASHCISFNNVNLILPLCKRVTYFHQAKVFSERSLRFRLISLAIALLRWSTIVVQSPLIAQRFRDKFGNGHNILVKWPGISPEQAPEQPFSLQRKPGQRILLWPVTDPTVSQKNLNWMVDHQAWIAEHNVQILITSTVDTHLTNCQSMGSLTRAQLFDLYTKVDGVLIVSDEETLCLPIFEAASVGAQVWVLDRPYIQGIKSWRGLPEQVHIFEQAQQIAVSAHPQEPVASHAERADHDYYKPDWQIY